MTIVCPTGSQPTIYVSPSAHGLQIVDSDGIPIAAALREPTKAVAPKSHKKSRRRPFAPIMRVVRQFGKELAELYDSFTTWIERKTALPTPETVHYSQGSDPVVNDSVMLGDRTTLHHRLRSVGQRGTMLRERLNTHEGQLSSWFVPTFSPSH